MFIISRFSNSCILTKYCLDTCLFSFQMIYTWLVQGLIWLKVSMEDKMNSLVVKFKSELNIHAIYKLNLRSVYGWAIWQKYHITLKYIFGNITVHDFITILCHVGFTILQVVWASQTNSFLYYKDKAFQGYTI